MTTRRFTIVPTFISLFIVCLFLPAGARADEWQTIPAVSEEGAPGGFSTFFQARNLPMGIYGSWITPDGTIYAGTKGAIYKSTDGGETWGLPLKTWAGNNTVIGVFVSKKGYIFASPKGNDLLEADRGLWRSTDSGKTWKRVLNFYNVPNVTAIWGIDEDAQGRLFAGTYGSKWNKTRIYRSTDGGTTWSKVYENLNADHIHAIKVDRRTGYIYATFGDRINGILRSTNGGASFQEIMKGLPQMVGIEITPSARLFGTDEWRTTGGVYMTTNDVTSLKILDIGETTFNYWLRRDNDRGFLYAGFVDDTAGNPASRIYLSKDDGFTWTVLQSTPTTAPYDGYQYASNIIGSLFYSAVQEEASQLGKSFRVITEPAPILPGFSAP